jgi:hypothetical protein
MWGYLELIEQSYYKSLKDTKMSKQGTYGNGKHTNLMIPQKHEIIRKLETGKGQTEIVASYNIRTSTVMI